MARKMFRLDQIPTVTVGTKKFTTKASLEHWLLQGQPVTPNLLEIGARIAGA